MPSLQPLRPRSTARLAMRCWRFPAVGRQARVVPFMHEARRAHCGGIAARRCLAVADALGGVDLLLLPEHLVVEVPVQQTRTLFAHDCRVDDAREESSGQGCPRGRAQSQRSLAGSQIRRRPSRGADVAESRRKCGRVAARMWPSRGADVAELWRRRGPSRGADVGRRTAGAVRSRS